MESVKRFELKKSNSDFKKIQCNSSAKIEEFARQFYSDDLEIYESVFSIYLDNKLNVIGWAKIAQGGLNSALIDVRLIAKYAIESLCTSVIVVHNHPSGTLKPSQSDIEITAKLNNTLKIFDVRLLDHLILTADDYTSFADENIFQF